MIHPFTSELHEMLLRVAGWMPDDVLCRARGSLAAGRCAEVADLLVFTGRRCPLPLDDGDLDSLEELLIPAGGAAADWEPVAPGSTSVWRFSADLDADGLRGGRVLLAEVSRTPGVRGLWAAVRLPVGEVMCPGPRVVYVVEVDDDGDAGVEPADLAGRFQTALAGAGERDPQVEVVSMHGVRPAYQRAAQEDGRLLWSPHPASEIRVARVVDEAPRPSPSRPLVPDENERARLVAYLDAGTELPVRTGVVVDVVDPRVGPMVPAAFRTDGAWVWTDSVSYHLRVHHFAPEPEFFDHLRGVEGLPPALDTVTLGRAVEALRESAGRQVPPDGTAGGAEGSSWLRSGADTVSARRDEEDGAWSSERGRRSRTWIRPEPPASDGSRRPGP